jgi:hypothetical protein
MSTPTTSHKASALSFSKTGSSTAQQTKKIFLVKHAQYAASTKDQKHNFTTAAGTTIARPQDHNVKETNE